MGETHNFYAFDRTCSRWTGTAVSDYKLKDFPFTHIRTTANVTWAPKEDQLIPGSGSVYLYPSGSCSVDIFEANGCVADVSPKTSLVSPTDGLLTIDYSVKPPVVSESSYGGAGFITTITDCNGMQLPGWAIGCALVTGPIKLNDKGDAFVYTQDLSTKTTTITVDYNYRIDRSQP